MTDISKLPTLKCSFRFGRKTPKLYMTPSPMTFPMKHPKTANQAQVPPSGAMGEAASSMCAVCGTLLTS